jgi:hypothetical protein
VAGLEQNDPALDEVRADLLLRVAEELVGIIEDTSAMAKVAKRIGHGVNRSAVMISLQNRPYFDRNPSARQRLDAVMEAMRGRISRSMTSHVETDIHTASQAADGWDTSSGSDR